MAFDGNVHLISYKRFFLKTLGIKDCNVMIDGKNFFDQPAKNDIRAYDKHSKNWDDYTTGCLLD